jgi:hypothetical protein
MVTKRRGGPPTCVSCDAFFVTLSIQLNKAPTEPKSAASANYGHLRISGELTVSGIRYQDEVGAGCLSRLGFEVRQVGARTFATPKLNPPDSPCLAGLGQSRRFACVAAAAA